MKQGEARRAEESELDPLENISTLHLHLYILYM